MKRKRHQSAFTLVETVVAVAILSLMIVAVYSTFDAVLGVTRTGARAAEQAHRERVALKTIEDALNGLVYYEQNQEQYGFIVDSDFDYPRFSFVSRLPADFLGNNDFNGQRLRRVEFAVEQSEDGESRSLVMYQYAMLENADSNLDQEPRPWILADNLDQIYISYWSTIVNDWVPEWEEATSIPTRIRFEMALTQPDGSAALVKDIQKREMVILSNNITQAEQNPPVPAAQGQGRGSVRNPSGRGRSDGRQMSDAERRKRYEDWKRREAAKRSENGGRSDRRGGARPLVGGRPDYGNIPRYIPGITPLPSPAAGGAPSGARFNLGNGVTLPSDDNATESE